MTKLFIQEPGAALRQAPGKMTNHDMTLIHSFGQLHPGTLIRRYKRFLADVRLEDGHVITAFTPNSGSMKTCSDPGSSVMLIHDPKPGRKTDYNLETLIQARSAGYTTCNLYIVQRSDCHDFAPARDIDPDYASTFDRAVREGVIMIACLLEVRPEGIYFKHTLPFREGEG